MAKTHKRDLLMHQFDGSSFMEKRPYLGSSGIGLCMRKAWYNLAWARGEWGVEDPVPPTLDDIYKMQAGTLLEDLVVSMLKASGYKLAFTGKDQQTVDTEWGTSGHPDGLILEDPDHPECAGYLLEVKTTGVLKYVKEQGSPDYHLHQTADYVFGSDAPGTKFIYLDRGWGRRHFTISHRHELGGFRQENERRAHIINKAIDTGDVNSVECTPADWECKSCGFRNQCTKGAK